MTGGPPCEHTEDWNGVRFVCTLRASHTDPAKTTPDERRHVLWAAATKDDD